MRISKVQAQRLADYARALRCGRELITEEFDRLLLEIHDLTQSANRLIAEHNANIETAHKFVDEVATELREEYDDKGDRWKDSERGHAAEAMVSEWEDVRLEPVALVTVLLPDPPHFEEGLNLPEESDA